MQFQNSFGEGQIIAPPRADAPELLGTGFVICPLALQDDGYGGDCSVEVIYRLAYDRARAALRPSWYEQLYRDSQN